MNPVVQIVALLLGVVELALRIVATVALAVSIIGICVLLEAEPEDLFTVRLWELVGERR